MGTYSYLPNAQAKREPDASFFRSLAERTESKGRILTVGL